MTQNSDGCTCLLFYDECLMYSILCIKVKVNKDFTQVSLSSSLCQRPPDQWITAWDYSMTVSVLDHLEVHTGWLKNGFIKRPLGGGGMEVPGGLKHKAWGKYGRRLSMTTPQNWPSKEAAASISVPPLWHLCSQHTFSSSARGQRELPPCQENIPPGRLSKCSFLKERLESSDLS